MKLTEEQMNTIENEINKSPLWHKLNESCKKEYEKANIIPSKEEYQALRNILICKVIMEDQQVRKNLSSEVWEVLENAK